MQQILMLFSNGSLNALDTSNGLFGEGKLQDADKQPKLVFSSTFSLLIGVFDMPNPNRYDILSISIF